MHMCVCVYSRPTSWSDPTSSCTWTWRLKSRCVALTCGHAIVKATSASIFYVLSTKPTRSSLRTSRAPYPSSRLARRGMQGGHACIADVLKLLCIHVHLFQCSLTFCVPTPLTYSPPHPSPQGVVRGVSDSRGNGAAHQSRVRAHRQYSTRRFPAQAYSEISRCGHGDGHQCFGVTVVINAICRVYFYGFTLLFLDWPNRYRHLSRKDFDVFVGAYGKLDANSIAFMR